MDDAHAHIAYLAAAESWSANRFSLTLRWLVQSDVKTAIALGSLGCRKGLNSTRSQVERLRSASILSAFMTQWHKSGGCRNPRLGKPTRRIAGSRRGGRACTGLQQLQRLTSIVKAREAQARYRAERKALKAAQVMGS